MLAGLILMSKVSNIPDAHNILRHAKKKHLGWELDSNGKPLSIKTCYPDLFKLRQLEKALSVNWIEFFDGTEQERIEKTIKDFSSSYEVKKYDAFAKFNVGEFKKICIEHSAKVRVIHEATKSIKSHSSITQLPQDNALLLDDLCKVAYGALVRSGIV